MHRFVRQTAAPTSFMLAVVLALGLLGLLTVSSTVLYRASRDSGTWALHSAESKSTLGRLLRMMLDAESDERAFLLTGAREYADAFESAARGVPETTAVLRGQLGDNPAQLQRLARLEQLDTQELSGLRAVMDAQRSAASAPAVAPAVLASTSGTMTELRAAVLAMRDAEDVLYTERKAAMQRRSDLALASTGLCVLLLGAIAVFLSALNAQVAREQLARELAVRARDDSDLFMGVIGHDLRNPLNAIALAAHSLERTSPEPAKRQAALISRTAQRMARMIDQLLDLTRARAGGGIHIELRGVDLADLCRTVLAEFAPAHGGSAAELRVEGDCQGRWDPDRLGQVLSNLVGNALEYRRPATVPLVTVRGEDAQVLIEVWSDSEPIAPEVLARIFEPFRRGSDRRRAQGLGLGLFIAREVVEAHGGHIEARSDPADGTRFTVWLPRAEATGVVRAGSIPA